MKRREKRREGKSLNKLNSLRLLKLQAAQNLSRRKERGKKRKKNVFSVHRTRMPVCAMFFQPTAGRKDLKDEKEKREEGRGKRPYPTSLH